MCFSQCPGLHLDAGPDMLICDTSQLIQLQGTVTGNYTNFSWTPVNGLSDPNILDPFLTNHNPGSYTFTLTADGVTANLITNGDFEAGNTGFNSQYNLWTLPGLMPPGYYAVDFTPGPYNPPYWIWPCTDHTTGGGKMMIVNGYNSPCNKDVWCQTVSVKPNTNYTFEVFFTCIYPNDPANIQISFNGNILGNVQLTISTCDWVQFTTVWNSGSTSSVNICLKDLLCGNTVGNDFAIDDISLIGPCVKSDEVKVTLVNLVAKIDTATKPKCALDTFELTGLGSSVGSNITYIWSTDVGNLNYQNGLKAIAHGSGTYRLKVIYTLGNLSCEVESEIEVYASDLEAAIEVEGVINCKLDTVFLYALTSNGSGNFSYQWTPKNKIHHGANEPVAFVTQEGTYKVVISDLDSDCKKEVEVKINLSDQLLGYIEVEGVVNCIKDSVQLKTSVLNGTGNYSYQLLLMKRHLLILKKYCLYFLSCCYLAVTTHTKILKYQMEFRIEKLHA